MLDISMTLGRFHPLIVHLPIGCLFLAALFKILDIRYQRTDYRSAFLLILKVSTITALFACITGFILSRKEQYPQDDLNFHQYGALILSLATGIWWYVEARNTSRPLQMTAFFVTVILLFLTGHGGGNLTHGKGYLTQGLGFLSGSTGGQQEIQYDITHIDSAEIYAAIVQPMLEARCYSCHSSKKQKGDLRLDSPEFILQGGESGHNILHKDLNQSYLYEAITAKPSEDIHMPPKGKPQLTAKEIEVLGAWASLSNPFQTTVGLLDDKEIFHRWYEDIIGEEKLFHHPLIPNEKPPAFEQRLIDSLTKHEILVQPVGNNSGYLEISLINNLDFGAAVLPHLLALKEQILWVEAPHQNWTSEKLAALNQLTKVSKLNLSYGTLPESGISALNGLSGMKMLNLTGISLTESDIAHIQSLPSLEKIYLYQTGLTQKDYQAIMESRPDLKIDTGGYQLERLPGDTVIHKFKGKK